MSKSGEDFYKVGDKVKVRLIDIDRAGKFKLSHKVLLPKPEGYVERPSRENNRDRDRDNNRGERNHRHNRNNNRQ